MPRGHYKRLKQRPVVPPPARVQPEDDPEFQALPPDRRTWVLTSWDHMMEMDRVRFKQVAAEAIAERYADVAGPKSQGHGFSRTSLMRRYAAWVKSQRDWRTLDRFRALHGPKAPPPERYNLTPDAAREYFRRTGQTMEEWAAAHKFSPAAVGRALNGTRTGPVSADILAALAAELRGEPAVFHADLIKLRAEWAAFDFKFAALERRLGLTVRGQTSRKRHGQTPP